MACSERSIRNLGDPSTSSDLPIRGRADHMGKGMTVLRNLQRKLVPDMKGWILQANLTEEDSHDSLCRLLHDVSNIEEPCAGKPHAGICERAVG